MLIIARTTGVQTVLMK